MYNIGYLLLIPAMIFALWAQFKVNNTFSKYSKYGNEKGLTGAQVASQLLARWGINDVRVERIGGNLTDHYDPKAKVLRLSDSVYGSQSLAALGVAAHETGHAVQHAEGYSALAIRNAIFPVVSIGSRMAMPLILLGFFLSYLSAGAGNLGIYLLYLGIALFFGVVVFQTITLPVEFNASKRAIEMLGDYDILTQDEINPAKKVLNAAAMTYLAAAAVSIAQLLRFILLASNSRRSN